MLGTPVGRLRDRGRVGYVPQRHTVSGAVPATVREVVGVGRLARLGLFRRPGAADRAAVADAVAAVGLSDRLRDPVASLSGGQQRRVLVARALAAEPDLLIMDEPTAGVDAANQQALAAVLAEVSARGTTLVVVTHEIGPMAGVLGRAVVVDHGRIRYDGPLAGAAPWSGGGHHHAPEAQGSGATGYRLDQPRVTSRAARPATAAADVEILEYGFMQRALLASLMVGLVAPGGGHLPRAAAALAARRRDRATWPWPASRSGSSRRRRRSARPWSPPSSAGS